MSQLWVTVVVGVAVRTQSEPDSLPALHEYFGRVVGVAVRMQFEPDSLPELHE